MVVVCIYICWMQRLAVGALRRIQKLLEMVKSFFRQPEYQYAAI